MRETKIISIEEGDFGELGICNCDSLSLIVENEPICNIHISGFWIRYILTDGSGSFGYRST